MGFFNRKQSDDRRGADPEPQARNSDQDGGAQSERPTEPMGTGASAPVQSPETDSNESAERDLKPPEPEATEPTVVKTPEQDTGSIEKDELRRAVSARGREQAQAEDAGETEEAKEAEAEDARVSAEDLIAPTPQRKHPFQPEVEQKRGERRMQVYAFANQKGGVAKTTTTLNLAVALKESGHDVLCIDLDPQGNLTMSQGIDPDEVDKSLYDVLVNQAPISEIIRHQEIDIAVASIDLAGAEIAMSTQIGRERALQKALAEIEDQYDFVCIDTPPSLGLLTINALTAADKVIVPVQCEYLSMRGLIQLQNTLQMIRENLNPDVQIEGILPTMLDSRTVHAKEAVEILEENFGDLVFKSRIKKAIKFAEAPVKGSSVLKYDPGSNAAGYYRDLAEEVLTHGEAT
ncbi:MAG TPA: AAA family ATPase [Solirubrobacterales bacterium]|nr:AAA family ATPase [Solirubrobacterales bacterium]